MSISRLSERMFSQSSGCIGSVFGWGPALRGTVSERGVDTFQYMREGQVCCEIGYVCVYGLGGLITGG